MNYQKTNRRFEISGFVNPDTSFYVPLDCVQNIHNDDMKTMVDQGRYFSIFAPRQSGKTTFFKMFSKNMEDNLEYIFILMSFETCSGHDQKAFYRFIQKILYKKLIQRLEIIKCHEVKAVESFLESHQLIDSNSFYFLFEKLNQLIKKKKIIIFIDEFDGIPLTEIKNFLTTLRNLYQEYKAEKNKALYSVGLVGIRNITQLIVGGVSPFNIADHVALPPFSLKNIRDLYQQYTFETNQAFTEEAVQKMFEQTQGQPWLVNRLGSLLTKQIKPETTEKITATDVDTAIECLLDENNNHFDNLRQKIFLYKQTFIKVLNETIAYNNNDQSLSFLRQYGLIKKMNKKAVVANPIYKKYFQNIDLDQSCETNTLKKKIFICYSHEDKVYLDRLLYYLTPIQLENIEIWYDEHIKTGEDWSMLIQDHIQRSSFFICLVSQNFLNSEFIRTREIPAIKDRQKEGMQVFPILVEKCVWNIIGWLKTMQIYPKDAKPLNEFNQDEQDNILMDVVSEIFECCTMK